MLVSNFASQYDLCEVRLAGEAMGTEHRPLGRVPRPFLPAAAGLGPHAEAPLPALLSAHAEVGVALAQPPGTMVAFAGVWTVDGTSLAEATRARQGSGTLGQGRHGLAGRWCHCWWLVGHGLASPCHGAQPWGGVGQVVPRPGVCRAVRGKGRAVCVCRFPCVPSTCDQWEFSSGAAARRQRGEGGSQPERELAWTGTIPAGSS